MNTDLHRMTLRPACLSRGNYICRRSPNFSWWSNCLTQISLQLAEAGEIIFCLFFNDLLRETGNWRTSLVIQQVPVPEINGHIAITMVIVDNQISPTGFFICWHERGWLFRMIQPWLRNPSSIEAYQAKWLKND